MRGYFGIGVERLSKPTNAGNLFRTAHAFGGSFVFTVNTLPHKERLYSDTSNSFENMPYYAWDTVDEMMLPKGCALVGIELLDDAIDLPEFRHPRSCAYVLGPEQGSLSEAVLEKCQYTIKIPAKFCVNVAIAGAIVMYDRMRSLGAYAARPLMEGGDASPAQPHRFGHSSERS